MSFAHAIIDPFNSDATGAQVPDLYPFATSTVQVKQSGTIAADANGNWDIALFASPMHTTYSNGSTGPILANLWATNVAATPNISIRGLLSPGDVQSYLRWRVVGFGVRLRSLLVPMTSTGVLQYATFPGPKRMMDSGIMQGLTAGTARSSLIRWYDLPQTDGTGYFSTTLENYTTASRMEHFHFNTGGFEWSAIPTGPKAFAWRDGQDAANLNTGNQWLGGDNTVYNVQNPATSANHNYDFMSLEDWSCLVMRGTNFPPSVNVADIEIILHMEYIDANTSTLGGTGKFPLINPGGMSAVCAEAATMPMYRALKNVASDAEKTRSRLGI